MNEQPQEIVSQFLAFVFIAISVATYFFGKVKPINLDYFELGQIHDNKPAPAPAKVIYKNTTPKKQYKKQVAKTPKKPELSDLQKDCINALKSLGFKKDQAKARMKKVFQATQPKTIQEFLMEAFKNEYN